MLREARRAKRRGCKKQPSFWHVLTIARWPPRGRQAELQRGVREALHTDADRAVAEVGAARLLDRVVVDVDHVVQVAPAQGGKEELAKKSTQVE